MMKNALQEKTKKEDEDRWEIEQKEYGNLLMVMTEMKSKSPWLFSDQRRCNSQEDFRGLHAVRAMLFVTVHILLQGCWQSKDTQK